MRDGLSARQSSKHKSAHQLLNLLADGDRVDRIGHDRAWKYGLILRGNAVTEDRTANGYRPPNPDLDPAANPEALHPFSFGRKIATPPTRSTLELRLYARRKRGADQKAIVEGYGPTSGIMHEGRDGSSEFVFDLMKPERPEADPAVLDFVTRGGQAQSAGCEACCRTVFGECSNFAVAYLRHSTDHNWLGSGLIDQSRKMTAAAMQIAEK
jgi:hypothetical protein